MRKIQKIALSPFSLIYSFILTIRHGLFNLGWLKSSSYDLPIIGIGNLSFGGTGKSPLTIYLSKLLLSHKHSVAIVSRGYGRSSKGLIEATETSSASEIGDEPYMYKLQLPQVRVVVSADRNLAVNYLINSDHPPAVILLDDSFQHRKIRPSLNLLLTTQSRPYWKDMLVPSGYLRDIKSAQKRADALILTKSDFNSALPIPTSWNNRPTFKSRVISEQFIPIGSTSKSVPQSFVCFSGIANNKEFQESIASIGSLEKSFEFNDHHSYRNDELLEIISYCNAETALVTTQKDYARLSKNQLDLFESIQFYYLPISIEFENRSEFDLLILDHVNSRV